MTSHNLEFFLPRATSSRFFGTMALALSSQKPLPSIAVSSYAPLPDTKIVEIEIVGRFRNRKCEKLFSIFVDVGREPAPVAVLAIVEVIESALPEMKHKKF